MKTFLRGFLAVFKREVLGYFSTPIAYVILVIFLAGINAWTFLYRGFFDTEQASLRLLFDGLPLVFVFIVPAIAMRLWAEERKSNSIMLLLTLPVTVPQAVLAKFAAALSMLLLALALTFPAVLTVAYLGNPDPGPVIGGYVAGGLLGASFLAIGSLFSAVTRNQVIAFILAVLVCGLVYLLGTPALIGGVTRFMQSLAGDSPAIATYLAEILEGLSFEHHYDSLARGVLEIRNLVFFVLCTAGCLWINLLVLEQRRGA
jgi:ABC-2 type transport system permease protein